MFLNWTKFNSNKKKTLILSRADDTFCVIKSRPLCETLDSHHPLTHNRPHLPPETLYINLIIKTYKLILCELFVIVSNYNNVYVCVWKMYSDAMHFVSSDLKEWDLWIQITPIRRLPPSSINLESIRFTSYSVPI